MYVLGEVGKDIGVEVEGGVGGKGYTEREAGARA
jgi:hypothetical protein